MTRKPPLRRGLVTAAFMLLTAGAWLFLAPTQLGGSTSYVTTHGASMQPRFQTGDLALLRPAQDYQVGQIVAYRSKLLDAVVLHRIIARDGERYVFKGDNNDFIDPTHPGRSELIGTLWLRVPRAGQLLNWLRRPAIASVLIGGAALLLLAGTQPRRRRRARRRQGATRSRRRQGDRPVTSRQHRANQTISAQQVLAAATLAIVAFVVLGLAAFTRPTTRPVMVKKAYTEQVSFGYRAQAPRGPVYRGGRVRTGDPVFVRLVQNVRVRVAYRLVTAATHRISGTQDVRLRLTSPTGWSRSIQLAAPTRFVGNQTSRRVTLDLRRLRSLIGRVQRLTGAPVGGSYTLTVLSRVHLTGTLAGQPLSSDYRPALSFQLDDLQLRPASSATTSGDDKQNDLHPSRRASVAIPATAPNILTVRGHRLPVATARWIALAGLLLAITALLDALRRRRRPASPAAQIQARYKQLIVPIAGIAPNTGRPTIDVTSIDALAQLAERSDRLILHHHRDDTDTYLVDDEGTLYRYRISLPSREHPAAPSDATNRIAG